MDPFHYTWWLARRAFGIVGFTVARRVPRNPIGWILLFLLTLGVAALTGASLAGNR